MRSLLDAFPRGCVVVLLDNFESVVDRETFAVDHELDEALRALLETSHHSVKVIVTTQIPPARLMRVETARQTHLSLDEGLDLEFAEKMLRLMDTDGTVGLKTASSDILREAHERTYGFPKALEALFSILSTDRSTSLREVLDDTAGVYIDRITEVLVGKAFDRLDTAAQNVLQALAIYGRPVLPSALTYLLSYYQPEVDTIEVLRRLVNIRFARKDGELYGLHPIDRRYALSRIPRGEERDRDGSGVPTFTQIALLDRAADYFKQSRKPLYELARFEDVGPALAEFDLRRNGADFDEAARVLTEIDISHLSLWGQNELVEDYYEDLLGAAARPNSSIKRTSEAIDPMVWDADSISEPALWEGCLINDPKLRRRCLFGLGVARYYLGEYPEAIAVFGLARALANAAGDLELEGMCFNSLADCTFYLGRLFQARDYENRALSIADDLKDGPIKIRLQMFANGRLATCDSFFGDTQVAKDFIERALAAAHQLGDQRSENLYSDLLGLYRYFEGDTNEALSLLENALAIARQINDWYGVSKHLGNIVEVHVARRDFQEAIRICDSLKDKYSFLNPVIGSWTNVDLAISCLHINDLSRAREAALESCKHDVPLNNFNSAAVLGLAAIRQGDHKAAREAFLDSKRKAEDMLKHCEINFFALLAKGLSYVGLAVCDDDTTKRPLAIEAYNSAFDLIKNKSPGHVMRNDITLECLLPVDRGGHVAAVRDGIR
jgi:tetratricopeptide (TPR) repeat protein